jgi:DUF2889 family protein
MPLPEPASPRRRLHTRRVTYEGFQRDDGLFDIDARLTDVKDQDLTLLSGVRRAGEAVHDMSVRVTIDRQFNVVDLDARSDAVPYPGGCEAIGPHYRQLIGANLLDGFRKKLHDTLGHVKGCTHITELLVALPTAALQTFAGLMAREDEGVGKPFQLDRCHALETSSDTVRLYYPRWYRGAA